MSTTKLLYPAYFQVARCDGKDWFFTKNKQFYNPSRILLPSNFKLTDKLSCFGTTMAKLVLEFKLIGSGQAGYYLADLQDWQYYYCGLTLEDVRLTLQNLGIGRPERNY